jgi:hypothetical protein
MIIYPKDKFAARPFIFTLLLAEFFGMFIIGCSLNSDNGDRNS